MVLECGLDFNPARLIGELGTESFPGELVCLDPYDGAQAESQELVETARNVPSSGEVHATAVVLDLEDMPFAVLGVADGYLGGSNL